MFAIRRAVAVHALVWAVALPAARAFAAQAATATVTGVVRDTTEAVVAGAAVQIAEPRRRIKRLSTTTDGQGRYRLLYVPVGEYHLSVEAAGFVDHERQPHARGRTGD